ncbi:MAG: hypothetical protein ACOYO0_14790, partial [Sandarakinorhabdus sp.]
MKERQIVGIRSSVLTGFPFSGGLAIFCRSMAASAQNPYPAMMTGLARVGQTKDGVVPIYGRTAGMPSLKPIQNLVYLSWTRWRCFAGPQGTLFIMQVQVRKLEGSWDLGYALHKHTLSSVYLERFPHELTRWGFPFRRG